MFVVEIRPKIPGRLLCFSSEKPHLAASDDKQHQKMKSGLTFTCIKIPFETLRRAVSIKTLNESIPESRAYILNATFSVLFLQEFAEKCSKLSRKTTVQHTQANFLVCVY